MQNRQIFAAKIFNRFLSVTITVRQGQIILYGGVTVLSGKVWERGQGTCSEMLFCPDLMKTINEYIY